MAFKSARPKDRGRFLWLDWAGLRSRLGLGLTPRLALRRREARPSAAPAAQPRAPQLRPPCAELAERWRAAAPPANVAEADAVAELVELAAAAAGLAGAAAGVPERARAGEVRGGAQQAAAPVLAPACERNTKGYSSTYLAMGLANVRAGTRYPPEHSRIP